MKLEERHYKLGLLLIVAVAFLLREYYVLVAIPEIAIRGDIREYVRYAINLFQLGTFSMQEAGAGGVLPDAYRSPGFPVILALSLWLGGVETGWYGLALQFNVLFSVATVLLVMLTMRPAFGRVAALVGGVLMAFWPHHIAATGVLLSEVMFGACLALMLYVGAMALRSAHAGLALVGGGITAVAGLVNPLALPFGLVLAGVHAQRRQWRCAGAACLGLALLAGPWMLRSALIDEPPEHIGRSAINLAQGAFPGYHDAHRAVMQQSGDVVAAEATMATISRLAQQIDAAPLEGLGALASHLAQDPIASLRWYALEKPWLLWSWDIRIGRGGVHFHRFPQPTPLETHPVLVLAGRVIAALNPALFAMALALALVVAVAAFRRGGETTDPFLLLLALGFLYVTVVHVVFQAEPRYATAYRWLQVALAVGALQLVLQRVHGRFQRVETA